MMSSTQGGLPQAENASFFFVCLRLTHPTPGIEPGGFIRNLCLPLITDLAPTHYYLDCLPFHKLHLVL